jgi:chromodomain-helicase-DNA-binding protein 1
VKWKGYSHIHNTDELYTFLKAFKGFKKVDNYITKVWTVEQQFRNPSEDATWKPTTEDLEQYEIDRERARDTLESYKTVERVLDEKEERRDEGLVSLFFCKWSSESISMYGPCANRWTDLQYADSTWESKYYSKSYTNK